MNDIPRQKLRELIARYGRSLCDDPLRCEGLLKDFCGQNRLEVFALSQALRDGIPSELLTSSEQLPVEVLVSRFSKRLEDRYGMNSDLACWAIESWALALGLVTEDQLKSSDSPEAGSSTSTEKAAGEAIKPKPEDGTLTPLQGPNKKKSWFPKFALLLFLGFLAVAVFALTKNAEIKRKESPPNTPITKGSVEINSAPSGAKCYFDNKLIGETPRSIDSVEQGRHFVQVFKEGYQESKQEVAVQPGGNHQLIIQLNALPQPSVGNNDSKVEPRPEFKNWKEPITGMEFVWVPAGCYQMGCGPWAGYCWADEVPVHEVCLDGFWISKYEVTQGQWLKVMPKNPSRFKKGEHYPVEQVSWNEVHDFLERLNSKSTNIDFRLPTEAEWEYAARSGGKNEMFAGGDDAEQVAWYAENSAKSTHPVGSKNPNGLGIYDMSGNVWEWCEDSYAWDAYTTHSRNNPVHKYPNGEMVFRGGSWASDSYSLRTVRKVSQLPTHRSLCVGFRPVAVSITRSDLPNKSSPEQLPNLAGKTVAPVFTENKWLVILGSDLKEDRHKAEERLALVQPHCSGVRIVDTQDYPNLRSGFWAVIAGPFDKETAIKEKQRLSSVVPDAFVKSGW
jgi:formylglycine-generating enzyme required for sulfatase activity